ENESRDLGLRLDALDQEIAAHLKNVEVLEQQIAQSRGRMAEINRQRESLQARVLEREKTIESGRQLILRLLGAASTLKNQLAQIEEYLAGIERETARSAREERAAAGEIERLETARKQLSETMAQRQLELELVTGERRHPEEQLAEQRRAAAALRQAIDALKNEVSQTRARKESLEQVLAHRTYTTESVKRLCAALDGRATFLVHPESNGNGKRHLPEPPIGPETGITARLSESLRLTNGFKDRAVDLLPRVSLCFLADDRAAAQRLAVSYPHLFFLLPDGVCYHGHTVTGGRKSGAGPLAMKREARELAVTLRGRQAALDEQVARLDGLTQEIIALEAELERLRALQQSREKDRVALDHEMRKLGDDLSRSNSRLSVARLELDH